MKLDKNALALAAVFVFFSTLSIRAESNPPTAPAATAPAAAAAPVQVEVLRMVLARNVQDREPVEEITSAQVGDTVVGWTQIGSEGGEVTLTHRWLHENENMGDVSLVARSSPWRTWSRKTVSAPGNWKLQVLDPQGAVLKETAFTVTAAAPAAAAEPPAAAPVPAASPK